ncbi:5'-3' exonuclease H3TH domain-containing protein [Gilvimarinus sp. SDUM040013]|uniref:5'-3' exonuclease H3TH domain-containing protein n=1 Tax=Gilvimarinus gilvus TaxID=3058038 RepID=A0ABU4S307_9GAMM|nr:5'-3' exonuclease H3TH domain-containing protein [Gilvimarinus sp. SDUM040013]MDO3385425.1 5'-3' exonuclease H3TH domain-containing protein [Gilvimarinus sp. SDUM040013]MDX6851314.1 5'-3' exonuclease H3TH domain-containing protein [Gilvimarinus sp. SDUM040013]
MSDKGRAAAPVCLIDASIYIFRYYFAMPANWFSEPEGHSTEAVYGFAGFLVQLLGGYQPTAVAVCFDESLGSGFRHRLSPDYKSSRVLPDEALAFQLKACVQVAQLLGLATYASDEYEADDLLASLYSACAREEAPVAILSRDKDLAQVFRRDCDFLWDYSDNKRYFPNDIATKFGVSCQQLVDYQALLGDAIDDIPGVPGIGAKTAAGLLTHGGSIAALQANPSQIAGFPMRGAKTLAQKLSEYRGQIALSQQLAGLVQGIELIDTSSQLHRKPVNCVQLTDFCQKMGWSAGMIRRLTSPFANAQA